MSTKIRLIQSFPDITFEKIKLGIDKMSMREALVSSSTKQDLEPTFRTLFRGVFYNGKTVNKYVQSCFNGSKLDFLISPVTMKKAVYYNDPELCRCFLMRMIFDPSQVNEFFFNVERVYRQYQDIYRDGIGAVLSYFDEEYMRAKCQNMKNEYAAMYNQEENAQPCDEYRKLIEYWNYYLDVAHQYHLYLALGLLILFSIFNAGVIHLLPSIRQYCHFSTHPIRSQQEITNGQYVIGSALAENLFLSHSTTNEILSEDDHTNAEWMMLFTTHRYMMNRDNAIFYFEEADSIESLPDPEDYVDSESSGLDNRRVEVVGKSLTEVVDMLMGLGRFTALKNYLRRHETRYYIKVLHQGEYYYMQYVNWFKESKILFRREKTKKSTWFVELQSNGSFKISPCGIMYYNLFTLDIPNATTQTYNIPLWMFPGTGSKAQRFNFYKVIPFREEGARWIQE